MMDDPRQSQLRSPFSIAVAILLPDRFCMASLGAALDVLGELSRRLSRSENGTAISYRLIGSNRSAASLSGVTIAAERIGYHALDFDLVLVPDVELDMLDSGPPHLDAGATSWLREQQDAGAVIAVHGASSLILAEAGLIRNREIAMAGWARSERARHCGRIKFRNEDFVEDGTLYSSSGAGTDHELVLIALRRWLDPATLDRFAEEIGLIPRYGHMTDTSCQDQALAEKVKMWIDSHYASHITLGDMARELAVSERTLSRHFRLRFNQTPIGYLQSVRIDKAQKIIRTFGYGTSRTAAMVGYRNVRFFKQLFRERVGIGPKEYRSDMVGAGIRRVE